MPDQRGTLPLASPFGILVVRMPTPSLSAKLHPSRFPGMSPLMAAIVGFVLGESFTHPEIGVMTDSEGENLL